MKHLPELLHRNTVHLDVPCTTRSELLQWMADYFSIHTLQSAAAIYKALEERENLGSTGLGRGVAIPHGRIRGIDAAHTVIVRTTQPIEFDAPDDTHVQLFFALLVPEKATDTHLEVLSEIVHVFSTDQLRTVLNTSQDTQEILDTLCHPSFSLLH